MPNISFTILSAPLISPTNISILKITSPIYFHIIVTVVIDVSILGVLVLANAENIIHASTITAPSKHTPTYDFINAFPIKDVVSPANDDNGIGAKAVYI